MIRRDEDEKLLCRHELLHRFTEFLRVGRVSSGDLAIHKTGGEKLFDFGVEVLHSLGGAFLHRVQQVVAGGVIAFQERENVRSNF